MEFGSLNHAMNNEQASLYGRHDVHHFSFIVIKNSEIDNHSSDYVKKNCVRRHFAMTNDRARAVDFWPILECGI